MRKSGPGDDIFGSREDAYSETCPAEAMGLAADDFSLA
jgi:hypothetical protein